MSLKNNNVLVTGANGFIGKHLVNRLLKEGANISVITRRADFDDVKNYKGDITDEYFVKKVIEETNPKRVYHLAASLENSPEKKKEIFNVNVDGTLNLLNSLKGKNCESFIFLSTTEIYGNNKVPFVESMKPKPISPYSESKLKAEMLCFQFYKRYNLPITIIRSSIVYGPKQLGKMFIPSLISSLVKGETFDMTKGEQTRDFIYVDDLVEAIILASLNNITTNEVINVCSGLESKISDVAKIVIKIINNGAITYNQPYRQNEQWRYYGDNSKAKSLLGWEPKIKLEEGLRRTVEWHKNA